MNKQIKKIVKKSGLSVFWGLYILPTKERRAIYTLYAFCRHIDDIVSGSAPLTQKMELLNAWRKELDNIYDKKVPESDIGRNIYKNCMRFNLPKQDLIDLLNGISMNLPRPLQAPSLPEFERYCQGVACAPGSLSLRILGCRDETLIRELSTSLGMAVQMTEILRNIRDDAVAGRLYIPRELLQKAGIMSTDPMTVVVDNNLVIAREELGQTVEKNYNRAFELLTGLDKKTARNIRVIAYIYKRYFDMMKNRGWEVISPKPRLGWPSKIFLILKAFGGR